MALILAEDQLSLQTLARDFVTKEIKPYIQAYDKSGEFPEAQYRKGFELGFHLLDIPEKFGGMGLDHRTMCVILEEFGKVEPAFGITMLSTSLTLECVLVGGTEAQIARACEIIIPGGFGTFSLTEPDSGSDSAALRTTAVRDGDHYVLNGHKCFATNAGYADLFVVFATVDRSLGAKGITAFMVEKGTPGLSIGKHEDKMGLRLSNTCDILLEDVRVPVSSRLGEEGEGFRIAMRGLDAGRTYNSSISTGLSQAAIGEAVNYSKLRKQFGKPLYQHEAIAFMLADMEMQTEAGRQLSHGAAALMDQGLKATKEASMAKCFCADTAMQVTTDVVQILGGYGYSREYPVEKMMRDAKIFQIFEGTNQIQRVIIANTMLKG